MSDWPLLFSKSCFSLAETNALAAAIAPLFQPGDIVTLTGTLGAGKTAFARAAIQTLIKDDEEVPSPTYNLLLTYDCLAPDFTIYHYDLYRLEQEDDVLELDIDDAFEDGVSLIEWPDRMGRYLPQQHLEVKIESTNEASAETRLVSFFGDAHWARRLASMSGQRDA